MCASARAKKHFLNVSLTILEKHISLILLEKPTKCSSVVYMWVNLVRIALVSGIPA